jgi:hypothetical protein
VKFLGIFLAAEMARDIAERSTSGKRFGVDGVRRFFIGGRSLLIFLGFDLRAIFRSENFRALQIFFGVNVLGFFLLGFLTGVFLFGGVGNILGGALSRANRNTNENSNPAKD